MAFRIGLSAMLLAYGLGACNGGSRCETDADCDEGSECIDGRCLKENICQSDADCPPAAPVCDLATGECQECVPDCLQHCCGDDGCGGTCPDDCEQTGQTCDLMLCTCQGVCQPDCGGKQCGPDGCGDSCPPGCSGDEVCTEAGLCESCQPDCQDKECGPDGCGDECAPGCASGETCDADGLCSGCTPDCVDRECGPDGCQATCGECPEGSACLPEGTCQEADCNDTPATVQGTFANQVSDIHFDQGVAFLSHKRDIDEYEDGCIARVELDLTHATGCRLNLTAEDLFSLSGGLMIQSLEFSADSLCPGFPDSTEGTYRDMGGLVEGEVVLGVLEVPGDNVETSCVITSLIIRLRGELQRTSDGELFEVNQSELVITGGFTSTGDFSLSCPCQPDCTGKECGSDGCQGLCGDCASDQFCLEGQCACAPQCTGRDCGPDGCGDTCGTCAPDAICLDGQCCIADCQGKECGPDGCGGSCSTCDSGQVCQNGQCGCVPDCLNKECGPNGCGGSCGSCLDGQTCSADQRCTGWPDFECTTESSIILDDCLEIPYLGCCAPSDVAVWCEGGSQLFCLACPPAEPCGWVNDTLGYYCGGSGLDPSGQLPIDCADYTR